MSRALTRSERSQPRRPATPRGPTLQTDERRRGLIGLDHLDASEQSAWPRLYQFSPEFFFSTLNERTGFDIERVLLVECVYPGVSLVAPRRAYLVSSPHVVRERVGVISRRPLMLLVHAVKRAHLEDPFATAPQQSDYETQWQEGRGKQPSSVSAIASRAVQLADSHKLCTTLTHHALGVRERRRYSLRNTDFFVQESP